MKRRKLILYHIIAWLLYIIYDQAGIWRVHVKNGEMLMLLQLTFRLSLIVVFYYCYLFVYPRFLRRGKTIQLIISLVFVPIVFSAIRYFLQQIISPWLFGFGNYFGDITLGFYLSDNLYEGLPMIVISAAVWSVQDAFKKEQENELLKQEKIRAELSFLKTQINPHFLFNTLNYIYSLAYPVSDKLADTIIKLSQLMRYMLAGSADGMVDLQKEIDYINDYIEIYRLRFEESFFVDFKVDGNIAGKRIASLVLIPFVENAFKHGVVNGVEVPVKIGLKLIGDKLIFTVSNKINRDQKDHSSGIGLTNIRRRLELIYPNQHELLIADNGQTFKTTLNINLTK